ncbi:MAG TPA: ANTAR domain-containing protein [Methylophilaceae bacterium]|nr:ANTAR domain-containing protein [Methylophilaceae bacterium]
MLRVILVDNHLERSAPLKRSLTEEGYEVVAHLTDTADLDSAVNRLKPDVVIIDTNSPSRDTLENICVMSLNAPRPVVMFSHDGNTAMIRAATQAGVSAYVVGGIPNEKLRPVMDAAIARFDEYRALRNKLEEANTRLVERKIIERAKGLLMKQRGMDEDAAYILLRNMAMQQNIRLSTLAERVVQAAKLLC